MQKESENTARSPFHEKNDLENFFPGGGRREVLSRLQGAVNLGVPLLILTGEEGSGKTMICCVLEQEVAEDYLTVYFPQTVESFEDVVRSIGHKLGVDTDGIDDGKKLKVVFEEITQLLLENSRHLLIIFDEAENIYLATLERIRKMLGQLTEVGVYLHVLFSGRSSFLENYDQLIICDFKQVEEVYLSLVPLSEEETTDYLRCSMSRLPNEIQKDAFSEEAIAKIYAIAKGNFRMINILAEESSVTSEENSSFMVLLDSVAEEEKEVETGWKIPQFTFDIRRFMPMMPWAGGVVAIIFLLVLVFGSGDEEDNEEIAVVENVVEKQPEVIFEKERLPKLENSPAVEPVLHKGIEKPEVQILKEKEIVVEKPEVQLVKEKKIVVEKAEVIPEKEQKLDDILVQKPTIVQEKQEEVIQPKNIIVELYQSPPLKKKISASTGKRRSKIKVQPRTEVQKALPTYANLTVDQLYNRRVAAGKEWKNGARDRMYTIQLMALAAENAEENLKQMLSQEKYREYATKFFIFKKGGPTPVIFVYYGEYPTIAEARGKRKTIPAFLQKHKPYAISIKGAVAKVEK